MAEVSEPVIWTCPRCGFTYDATGCPAPVAMACPQRHAMKPPITKKQRSKEEVSP